MITPKLSELATVIAEEIPEMTLRGIIAEDQPGQCFDIALRRYEGPAEDRLRHGVATLLSSYSNAGVLELLLSNIYDASLRSPGARRLQHLIEPCLDGVDRKQALLSKRDFFFRTHHLHDRLSEFMPKVCCIVGSSDQGTIQGTGFLVGPDLVLTAMHVFEPLSALNEAEVPNKYRVFFDHKQGAPISSIEPVPAGVRGVSLAQEWKVASARSFKGDGEIAEPTLEQQEAMKQHLDFVLIRLSEKVGLEPASAWGGRARAWIHVPKELAFRSLSHQEGLMITQHPAGSAQCVDFGRYEGACISQTRIYYSVNTAKGSSGAPCFDRNFDLVGMHNAEYCPAGAKRAQANQAIRFDSIHTHIVPFIEDVDLPPPAKLWNISSHNQTYRPIIGRSVLLKWIEDSTHATASIRERTFAVLPASGQGGKTFSWEVLAHCLKDDHTHVSIIFGGGKNSSPTTLKEMVKTLFTFLKVPDSELSTMPSETEGDGEKINRWASLVVPRWFSSVLETHRIKTIDRGDEARKMVQSAQAINAFVSQEIQGWADDLQPQEEQVEQWAHAWVVLDDLPSMTMNQDVQNFIAAIIQMGNSANDQYQVLERLRWMFLGECPGFLDPAQVCIETLSAETYAQGLEALAGDIASAVPYAQGERIREATGHIQVAVDCLRDMPWKPSQKLSYMQNVVGSILESKLPLGTAQ